MNILSNNLDMFERTSKRMNDWPRDQPTQSYTHAQVQSPAVKAELSGMAAAFLEVGRPEQTRHNTIQFQLRFPCNYGLTQQSIIMPQQKTTTTSKYIDISIETKTTATKILTNWIFFNRTTDRKKTWSPFRIVKCRCLFNDRSSFNRTTTLTA